MSSELSFSADADSKFFRRVSAPTHTTPALAPTFTRNLHSCYRCSLSRDPQAVRAVARPVAAVSRIPVVGRVATAAIPGVGPALAAARTVSTVSLPQRCT